MKFPVTHEAACARVAARFEERWLRGYVASKLRRDPVFPAAYELLCDSNLPLLDVGCGLGLLPFYLRERGFEPAIHAVDLDLRKIRRAQKIAAAHYRELEFEARDIRKGSAPFSGSIALFDLLHYLSPNDQSHLLASLNSQVAPDGVFLLRDCLREKSARFWLTYLAERFAQTINWNVGAPLHFPSRATIAENFPDEKFSHESRRLSGQLPFNNYLFTFRRRSSAVVPAAG